jgi:protein XagA
MTNFRRKDMKRSLILFVAAVLFAVASTAVCHAGAWTEKKGSLYEKLAFNYYYADHTFDSSKHRHSTSGNGRFSDYNFSNYFEYGLTDDITLINSLSYKWLDNNSFNNHTKAWGIGDVDVAAKYKLMDNRAGIVSTQLLVKIPGPYGRTDSLPLGNGQFDLEVRLLYGRSLYPLIPGYANVEAGYRFRDGDPSDEFRYLVEFGVDITKALYGRAKLDGILSSRNGSKIGTGGNPTATNNYDLGKLDLTVGYKITPKWSLEASFVPEVYGRNTASGSTWTLAICFQTP